MPEAQEVQTWFLILGLFLPRVALVIAWFSGAIPLNPIPFWGDVIMAVLFPRFLIMFYVLFALGGGAWFWAYLIMSILALFGYAANVAAKIEAAKMAAKK